MRRIPWMVLLLVPSIVLFGGLDLLPVAHAQAGVSVVSVYPVYETGIKVGVLFPVQVRLSLADGQSINAFDVQMNYRYDTTNLVLQPESIDYSSNSILAGSQITVLANCIDGIESAGTHCPAGEGVGTSHFPETLIVSKLTGHLSGRLLTFNYLGSYPVALNVTDSYGKSGVWSSVVGVLPALGSLKLTVVDRETGNPISVSVAVKLFNNSLTLTGMNASLDSSGHVIFDRLVLGSYVLKISGPSIEAYSKTETVSLEGWPTQDTIYLNVIHQSPNISGDLIFIGSLVAAVGVVTVGVFVKRRNSRKKGTAGNSRVKTRSR